MEHDTDLEPPRELLQEEPPFAVSNPLPETDSEDDGPLPNILIEMHPLLERLPRIPETQAQRRNSNTVSSKDLAFQSLVGTTNLDLFLERVDLNLNSGLFILCRKRVDSHHVIKDHKSAHPHFHRLILNLFVILCRPFIDKI